MKYQRATVEKISEGDRSIRATGKNMGDRSIRGRQKYQRATVEKYQRRGGGDRREPQRGIGQLIKYDSDWRQLKKYQRATEVSEGGRSIRGLQLKKYQMATEVSEGERSIRGRQLKKISEGDRSIRG